MALNQLKFQLFLEIELKGIDVICLAGDIGKKVNEFYYKNPDGVEFLASGIAFYRDNKKALKFYYTKSSSTLEWKYIELKDL